MKTTVDELARWVGGDLVGDGGGVVTGVVIDSRRVTAGDCFVALRGERDGHDFVGDAFARGAAAAVVARASEQAPGPSIVVDDPLAALGALARARRDELDAAVVGITGSVGKTATKDLLAAALGGTRRVHASPASFNNEAGVPLTLLGAPGDVEVVLCEMGARRAGDLTYLAGIARPVVGVVTGIGLAHLGPLGGTEGVVRAKGELLEHLPPEGTAVLDADSPHLEALAARARSRVLTVGAGSADVVYRHVRLDDALVPTFELVTPWGSGEVALAVRGVHQATNAAMAAAVALALDTPFASVLTGLAKVRSAPRRMELHETSAGVRVLDDSYNANPTSTAAALRALAAMPATRRVAVLGEMLELGTDGAAAHRELGALATELGIDLIVAVGAGAAPVAEGASGTTGTVVVDDRAEAARLLAMEARSGDAVLVKASRAVGMETVVAALLEDGT